MEPTMSYFTKRRTCLACLRVFTITSAASKWCQDDACRKRRRRADYAARKRSVVPEGSDGHLERAITSGD